MRFRSNWGKVITFLINKRIRSNWGKVTTLVFGLAVIAAIGLFAILVGAGWSNIDTAVIITMTIIAIFFTFALLTED